MQYVLSYLIWIPIISGMMVCFLGEDRNPRVARLIALGTVIVTGLMCIPLLWNLDTSTYAMQYTEEFSWMPSLGIQYSLGVDGLSLLLIALSIFTNLVVILATWSSIKKRVAQYFAALLIMQGFLVGVF